MGGFSVEHHELLAQGREFVAELPEVVAGGLAEHAKEMRGGRGGCHPHAAVKLGVVIDDLFDGFETETFCVSGCEQAAARFASGFCGVVLHFLFFHRVHLGLREHVAGGFVLAAFFVHGGFEECVEIEGSAFLGVVGSGVGGLHGHHRGFVVR